jgi:chromatin segregation and condensation protein Rec8/ScpA/Scc1 (kleisin family)
MAKVTSEGAREFENPDDLSSQVKEYLKVKATLDLMEARQKELREKIFAQIDESGEVDDKGNIILELPKAIKGISIIQKQRRVTRKINEDVADRIIAELNLSERLYEMVRVIDEDELMAAMYDGEITEEQLEEMYPAKVVWALMTKK